TQDVTQTADVVANGDLHYATTGEFTNHAHLLAGDTLSVGAATLHNTATGEMSGTHTTVHAGALTNRGLIDSNGHTRIEAHTVHNIGTGRIYGDAVAIGAQQLVNEAETLDVDGIPTPTAATLAARSSLDIGTAELHNRDHALIFSAGSMHIGGALDAE